MSEEFKTQEDREAYERMVAERCNQPDPIQGDLAYFRKSCADYAQKVEHLTQKIEDLQDFANRWMEAAIALGSPDVRFDPLNPEAWAQANMEKRSK